MGNIVNICTVQGIYWYQFPSHIHRKKKDWLTKLALKHMSTLKSMSYCIINLRTKYLNKIIKIILIADWQVKHYSKMIKKF